MDCSSKIISILTKYEISFVEDSSQSKNTGPNCIGIQCPFCDDHSDHCGIFRDAKGFYCRKCGRQGSFSYLLSVLVHKPQNIIRKELEQSSISFEVEAEQQIKDIFRESEKVPTRQKRGSIPFPKYFEPVEKVISSLLENYLSRRNISKQILIDHKCGICQVGEHMNRLIVPVYFEGTMIGFQAADLTGKSELKYKADTKDSEIKNYFYRWDLLDPDLNYIVVVEGIVDAWRLLGNAVASFGTALSTAQKKLLIKKKLEKLILCMDGDAYLHALETSQYFTPFIDEVHVIQLPHYWQDFSTKISHDPDSYGNENVWELIKQESNI
jgi:hypothetical protein